jgi:branched-chain amino acid transport system substrate-binding protein
VVSGRLRRGRGAGRGTRLALFALLVTVVLILAACGGSDDEAAETVASEPTATTEAAPETTAETGAPAETSEAADTGAPAETTAAEEERVSDYVAYTGGTDGAADPSLPPVKIGWVNNEGGSIAPIGETSTAAADFAVQYINEHLGGVQGHPVELVKCFVKNSEEEGLGCGQQFLNDPEINMISYGGVAVGSDTIAATIKGQKPIIMSFANNPADQSNPNTWTLFGSGPFALYGWGQFGAEYLQAKSNAVLHPQAPGFTEIAEAVKEASEAAGMETTIVGFDPTATDLVGALTAAGAQDADMISPMIVGEQCLAFERAREQLGIDPGKVVILPQCNEPSLREGYGGDYPPYIYGIAQGGDAYQPDSPSGAAFIEALSLYGLEDNALDPWFPATFATFLAIDKFMNEIGYDNITPEAITEKVQEFQGPLPLGPPIIQCNKYPDAPAVCADGDYFFQYEGDGVFTRINGWFQTPIEIQEKLGARPAE